MRSIWICVAIVALIFSCSNYEDEEYLNEENRAIVDLIPEMIDLEDMLAYNDYQTNRPTLIVIEDLYNELNISEYDSVSDIDRQRFKPLISKKIKSRKLTLDLFKNIEELNIKLISEQDYKKNHDDRIVENVKREKLFGYLWITRVVFTDNFQSGYVSFSFFCGEACAWNSAIEIRKVNGRWTESRYIFGGIA